VLQRLPVFRCSLRRMRLPSRGLPASPAVADVLPPSQLSWVEPDRLRERFPVVARSGMELLLSDEPIAYLEAVRDHLLN
jgi:hypothetical protein